MKKIKLLFAMLCITSALGMRAQSWEDVTSFYLTNADFEGTYTQQATYSSGSNTRYLYAPNGWTVTHTNKNENDITILKSGDAQSASFKYFDLHPTDGGDQAYLVRFRWGGQYWDGGQKGQVDNITLSQNQTIPSGKYRISADLVFITSEETPSGWLRVYADKTAGGSLGFVDAEIVKGSRSGETISSGSASWKKKTTGEFELDADTEVKFAMEFVQSWRWEIQAGGDNYKLERYCPDGAYTIDAAASVCGNMDNWSLKTGTFSGDYAEHWQSSLPEIGDYLKYTLNNVPNGTYQVKVTAKSSNTGSRDGFDGVTNGANTYASIVAGSVEQAIPTWNALDAATGDSPQQYTLSNVMVTNGKLEVAVRIKAAGPNWMIAKIDEIQFQGTYIYDYNVALAAAEDAISNSDYDNVIGTERSTLETQIEVSPSTPSDYVTETKNLISNTEAFTAAKTNYDALVAEIAKAKALGIADATADGYAATSSSTAATALASTQNLKVAEYNYVKDTYQYGVSLGEWTSTGTNTSAATFKNEHWSGETHEYKNQNDDGGQGWNANSWSINFSQDVALPAGNYVFKVAGRQASGDQVTTSLVVTDKSDDSELGTVNDFPRSNNSRGINKDGDTSFDPNDAAGFANDGAGFGWEWRYVKFTLDYDATVNIAINAVATAHGQWVSFGDYTLQTDDEANISLIAYNIALGSAQTVIADEAYKNVTGSEKTDLQAAIDADGTLDKTDKDAIDAAKDALVSATTAFTGAKSNYDTYVAAKAVVYPTLAYASAAKRTALDDAQTADATSASDAASKTAAIQTAARRYYESHALAEGVDDAEQITVQDYRFAGMTADNIDAANWKIGDNWILDGQNNGTISLTNSGSFTDGDGNADYNYIHIQKNDNNAGIHQTINLEPGRYMMTVTARCQSGQGAKFEAFAGGVYVSIPQNNNVGGQFDRGWNDVSVEFSVAVKDDISFGVKSDWGKNIWWSATRFRLVKLQKSVEVTTAGYATFASDYPLDFTNSGIKAYIATTKGDGTGVNFAQINKVPAGTGVLLYKAGGVTEDIPFFSDSADDTTDNVFVPGTGVAVASEGDGKKNYILSSTDAHGVGFYPASGKTVNEGKAYISVPASVTVKGFITLPDFDDDATGINAIDNGELSIDNAAIYNLAGQRISKMQKGINIINGRKVLY